MSTGKMYIYTYWKVKKNVVYVTSKKGAEIKGVEKCYAAHSCKHHFSLYKYDKLSVGKTGVDIYSDLSL